MLLTSRVVCLLSVHSRSACFLSSSLPASELALMKACQLAVCMLVCTIKVVSLENFATHPRFECWYSYATLARAPQLLGHTTICVCVCVLECLSIGRSVGQSVCLSVCVLTGHLTQRKLTSSSSRTLPPAYLRSGQPWTHPCGQSTSQVRQLLQMMGCLISRAADMAWHALSI